MQAYVLRRDVFYWEESMSLTELIDLDGEVIIDSSEIESFHSLIKPELIYHEEYRTVDDVRESVEWYVNWYNNERISSRIEWLKAS